MLCLLLLNVVGYYGILEGLKRQSGVALMEKFDAESHNTEEEITIKVPITIPYAASYSEFERVDGEFEHQGQVFRLVKQKLQNDTLFIVCMKDVGSSKINQELADYVKSYTDKPVNSKQGIKTFQLLSKDYISSSITIQSVSSGWSSSVANQSLASNFYFFDFNQKVIQPPEA